MNEKMKSINSIIQICEKLERYIKAHGNVYTGDSLYESYKSAIDAFDTAYRLKDTDSPEIDYLRTRLRQLYWQSGYSISYEEAHDIKHVVIQLKHVLFSNCFEKIFISHREIDKEQVHAFIELLYAIGIPRPIQGEENPIFCSSHPAAYIENGDSIPSEIKKQFYSHKHTFYILWYTGNYFRSQACLNEAGAIWIMDKQYQEILYPHLDRSRIQGLMDKQKVSFYSNDIMRLNTFKEQIEKMFGLIPVKQNYWETVRTSYVNKINEIYEKEQRG